MISSMFMCYTQIGAGHAELHLEGRYFGHSFFNEFISIVILLSSCNPKRKVRISEVIAGIVKVLQFCYGAVHCSASIYIYIYIYASSNSTAALQD